MITAFRDVSLVANAAKTQSDANKTSLGGCNLSYENGKYYIQVGADTGTKKPLGSGELSEMLKEVGKFGDNKEFDIKELTDDWAMLTTNNFVTSFPSTSAAGAQGLNNASESSSYVEYNSSTGILTCRRVRGGDGGLNITIHCTIYMVMAFS